MTYPAQCFITFFCFAPRDFEKLSPFRPTVAGAEVAAALAFGGLSLSRCFSCAASNAAALRTKDGLGEGEYLVDPLWGVVESVES